MTTNLQEVIDQRGGPARANPSSVMNKMKKLSVIKRREHRKSGKPVQQQGMRKLNSGLNSVPVNESRRTQEWSSIFYHYLNVK